MEGINSINNSINSINEKSIISEEQPVKTELEKTNETSKTSEQENAKMSVPKDEYISREKSGQAPTGLYNVEKDKEGNTVIKYDDPRKALKKVDGISSVQKLKSKKDSLKMQIKQVAGTPKEKELKKKLKEIEKQIKQAAK